MKTQILSTEGKSVKEIQLPGFFSQEIRQDIVQKVAEVEKKKQPYAPYFRAGEGSASGNIKRARRKFKTSYGYGISRVPRKIMWRRGSRFSWRGAIASGTVGGRVAHPPKIESMLNQKKVNKKEERLAFKIALASTILPEIMKKRYKSIEKIEMKLPIIVESEILKLKAKEFFSSLKKILGNLYCVAIREKLRASGKGKMRGRYRKRAGALFIIGKNENFKISGIEIRKADNISVLDLYPLGRLTIYTEKAIEELGKRLGEKK